ncbi:hypothetical protein [Aeromicrobium duanguangcaii]|uniref:WXG100 family type VII secretion target n=1 Tax=Aeromicrobium duanguangcaii TaxID=2968086 RepID=A0ABY5KGX0_9ACTN|nr:hypothetical protein [Aeromicrobium duanguangcaii]MCD9154982.1 hypothetical protein [Aeromicrobium duanguangcaii]UUI67613.1 hypothetical protein NP095_10395 [Aeromicrobium duanguangcaii]
MTPEETEDKTEPNLFRSTLQSAKTTVATCGDNVHSGYGSPLDAIANPLANGGWVCKEADTWITELKDQCAGINEAFDDAVSTISARIGTEPDKVPENDWRGTNWPRQWRMRNMY